MCNAAGSAALHEGDFLTGPAGKPRANQTVQAYPCLGGLQSKSAVCSGGTRTMNFPL